MHHFPFHISDIDQQTARLSLEQFGALVRLWMAYLKAEIGTSADPSDLDFATGARTTSERRAVQDVIKRYFTVCAEKKNLQSVFCEGLIEDYRAAGVQSRYANLCRHWEKANRGTPKPTFEQFAVNPDSWFETDTGRVRKVTGRNSLVLVSESHDSPNLPPPPSQPLTNNQEPITIGSPVVPKGTVTTALPDCEKLAEAVYALYPKKVGKAAALKAIVKVLKAGTITELELQTKVRTYAEAVAKWSEQDKTFIPNPATWFNQHRFDDDPATWIREPAEPREKKKGGVAEPVELFAREASESDVSPPDWRLWWEDLYTAPCPDTWADVPAVNKRCIQAEIARKKEGGRAK